MLIRMEEVEAKSWVGLRGQMEQIRKTRHLGQPSYFKWQDKKQNWYVILLNLITQFQLTVLKQTMQVEEILHIKGRKSAPGLRGKINAITYRTI